MVFIQRPSPPSGEMTQPWAAQSRAPHWRCHRGTPRMLPQMQPSIFLDTALASGQDVVPAAAPTVSWRTRSQQSKRSEQADKTTMVATTTKVTKMAKITESTKAMKASKAAKAVGLQAGGACDGCCHSLCSRGLTQSRELHLDLSCRLAVTLRAQLASVSICIAR